jgi:mycothiol synthase
MREMMSEQQHDRSAGGPPEGFDVRRPTRADLPALLALIHADEAWRHGEASETLEQLTARYSVPGLDLERDTWLAADDRGAIVGESWVWAIDRHVDFWGMVNIHPRCAGGPLASYLIAVAEARARELALPPAPGRTTDLAFYCPTRARELQDALAAAGYALVRHSYRMTIDPRAQREAPEWPADIVVSRLDLERDGPAVLAALDEAFAEHFRFTPIPYQHWVAELRGNPAFDESLWKVAWDGEKVAGVLGAYDYGTLGEVDPLGLRKEWRGRGLAKALLRSAFADFAALGREKVCLYVDAGNATGAVQLYESLGMCVAEEHGTWLKSLLGIISE